MTIKKKFENIISWYAHKKNDDLSTLEIQKDPEYYKNIENFIKDDFPDELRQIFNFYDGDIKLGKGLFLGDSLVSVYEMLGVFGFAESYIPHTPFIPNPIKANEIVSQMIEIIKSRLSKKNRFRLFKLNWTKLEFTIFLTGLDGPYLYTKNINGKYLKMKLEEYDKLYKLISKFHKLEKKDYNWDKCKIIVHNNQEVKLERRFYDEEYVVKRTYHPEKAIKKRCFHTKWIPVFSDGGGNYIGVDLDPDINGKKGQVIVFGLNEKNMFVIADSFEKFLDITQSQIDNNPDFFFQKVHLHDLYKKISIPDKM